MFRVRRFAPAVISLCVVAPVALCTLAPLALAQIVFEPPVGSDVGAVPVDILLGDFIEDGRADAIVTPFFFNGTPHLRKGLGNGAFGPAIDIPGNAPKVAADFDEDGHLDLLFLGGGVAFVVAEVWLGDGAGGFGSPASFSVSFASQTAVAAGDFDGDGHLDLAVALFQLGVGSPAASQI